MADGSYFDDRSGLYGAASGAIGLPIMLQLEGWVSTEIRYSFDRGQWQVLTTGGGFTAGAQLEFEKGAALLGLRHPADRELQRCAAARRWISRPPCAMPSSLDWNGTTIPRRRSTTT